MSLSSSIHGSPMTTPSSSHSSLPGGTSKYLIPQLESTPQMNGHEHAGKEKFILYNYILYNIVMIIILCEKDT
jgi:hypothetical protein